MTLFKFLGAAALAAVFLAVSCQSSTSDHQAEVNEDAPDEIMDTTEITFDSLTHDFGKVEQDQKISHAYTFTNTGAFPLVLKSVKASCGCTVPTWTKEPVAPGGTGVVEVEFNTTGRKGIQQKTVTVEANTSPSTTILRFTAEIPVPVTDEQ